MNQKLINTTHTLVKTLRALQRAQKDVEYKIVCWARDLRMLCTSEKEFLKWCEIEVGMTEGEGREFLDRASVAAVVTDADTFYDRGGFDKLRPILTFPKREQIAIVQAAGVEVRSIANVIKLRHPVAPAPGEPIVAPMSAADKRKLRGAALLARFIAEQCTWRGSLDPDVETEIRMYVPSFKPVRTKPKA